MNSIMLKKNERDILNIRDRLVDARTGESVNGGEMRIRTKIRCVGSDGSVLNTQNTTVFGGRRWLLETIFRKLPNTSQMLTLNTILGINEDKQPASPNDLLNRCICLVGCGTGGASLTFGQVIDATANDNNLFAITPLRTVPVGADLSANERLSYFMRKRVTINNEPYYNYYLKKVTNNEIVTKHQNVNYIPAIEDNEPVKDANNPLSLFPIQTFTSVPIAISDVDIKEYFRATEGNLKASRFNELSLYIGIPVTVTDPVTQEVYTDYIAVEAFSKLTFNNRPMDSEGTKYDFNYWIIT